MIRKFTSLLILFLAFQACSSEWNKADAQIVFAPVGAKWYYSGGGVENPNYTQMNYILLEVEKDTLVGTQNWQKLTVTSVTSYFEPDTPQYYDTVSLWPIFLYTSGDTVYYYNDTFATLLPLYIFNVTVGDTVSYHQPWRTCYNPNDTFGVIIDSITGFQVDGLSLKRIHSSEIPFSPSYMAQEYMERIGPLNDFLLSHNCGITIPEYYGPSLRCYFDSDISYKRISVPCDYLQTSYTNIPSFNVQSPAVYPNPAQSELTFSFPYSVKGRVRIFDLNGRIVAEKQLSGVNAIEFDVRHYVAGLYLYQITLADKVYTGKITIGQ